LGIVIIQNGLRIDRIKKNGH